MDIGRRLVVALVAIPVIVALVLWASPFHFFLVLGILAVLAQFEFYRLFHAEPMSVGLWAGILAGAALLSVIFMKSVGAVPPETLDAGVALGLLLLLAAQILFGGGARMAALPVIWLGLMYVPFLLGFLLLIRALPGGPAWMVYLLGMTWVVDAGGYFVGKGLGRHKMAPVLSPGKTWEGAVGGGIAGIGFSLLAGRFLPGTHPGAELWVIGLLLSVTGQVGDLAESAFKRQAGVKDSGQLLPGHGGMLDKVDSLLFNAPVLYGVLVFYEGFSSPVIV